jgi:hypothetical protein
VSKSADLYPIVPKIGPGGLIPTMLLVNFTDEVLGLLLAEMCCIGFR